MIIDSFLVEDGAVRGLELHLARFSGAVRRAGLAGAGEAEGAGDPRRDLGAFVAHVGARLPREPGRWFPRLEAEDDTGGVRFDIAARPAPPQGGALAVAFAPDRRREPRTKGPDLTLLGDVHAAGVAQGADEVVLVSSDGHLAEGTRTALLWWEDDVLCRVASDLPVLPSVTVAVLSEVARSQGVTVREAAPRPADLDGRETWLVNALHGIRPVRAWVGTDLTSGAPARAAGWQATWRDLAVPLPTDAEAGGATGPRRPPGGPAGSRRP